MVILNTKNPKERHLTRCEDFIYCSKNYDNVTLAQKWEKETAETEWGLRNRLMHSRELPMSAEKLDGFVSGSGKTGSPWRKN